MIDKTKVCWQQIFEISKEHLAEFVGYVSKSDSEYSIFIIKSIFQFGDKFTVLVEQLGDDYPYMRNRICSWVNSLPKDSCIHEPVKTNQIISRPFAGIKEENIIIPFCSKCGVNLKAEKWVEA